MRIRAKMAGVRVQRLAVGLLVSRSFIADAMVTIG
jgi:hypothetical protein